MQQAVSHDHGYLKASPSLKAEATACRVFTPNEQYSSEDSQQGHHQHLPQVLSSCVSFIRRETKERECFVCVCVFVYICIEMIPVFLLFILTIDSSFNLYIPLKCEQVSGIVEESAGISMAGKEVPSREDHSTLLHEHMNQELQGGIVSVHMAVQY